MTLPPEQSADIAGARDAMVAARQEAAVATRLFGAPVPQTLPELEATLAWLQLTPLPRGCDPASFDHPAWSTPKRLERLIEIGRTLSFRRERAGRLFTDAGLTVDWSGIRNDVATKGGRLFRFMDSGYRAGIGLLRGSLKEALPTDRDGRLKLIDLVQSLQKSEAAFASSQDLGLAFGHVWLGASSDWDRLDNILRWRVSHARLPRTVWPKLAALSEADLNHADRARQGLYAALVAYRAAIGRLAPTLALDPAIQDVSLDDLDRRLT